MTDLLEPLRSLLDAERVLAGARALLVLLVGLLVARIAGSAVTRLAEHRWGSQQALLLRRVTFYGVFGLAVASSLQHLGFDLTVLLGAAGILTVAIGFASQTSASNLISGLFLLGERPFVIGDIVRVGETTGEVIAVDLLSVKLRTFDNLLVRIPNETLLKSEITNLTRFPIRRIDVLVGVAYREDLRRVREVLLDVAREDLRCLDEPEPLFLIRGYGDSSIDLQFSVWTDRPSYLEVKTELQIGIKERFDAEGIEIPFPHRSLYSGSVTAPLPIRVVEGAPTPEKDEG